MMVVLLEEGADEASWDNCRRELLVHDGQSTGEVDARVGYNRGFDADASKVDSAAQLNGDWRKLLQSRQ